MGIVTCECSAIGSLAKLLTEETGTGPRTFTAASDRIEFLYEKLGTKRILQYTGAITGSISRFRTGVREHSYLTQGVIAVQPSPANLALWMPRILGGTLGAAGSGALTDIDADGNDQEITLGNILPEFDVLVYREAHIAQYTNCQVAQAFLRGRTSNGGTGLEFMELVMVIIGQEEIITQFGDPSPWPVAEPPLQTGVEYLPFTFWEGDLTMNGIAIPHEEMTLGINNRLSIRFYNERYPSCIRSTGRDVTMKIKAPAVCDPIREALAMNAAEGVAEYTLGTPDPVTMHAQFQMPFARSTFETPTTNSREELSLDIMLEGYSSVGNDELVVQVDQTP